MDRSDKQQNNVVLDLNWRGENGSGQNLCMGRWRWNRIGDAEFGFGQNLRNRSWRKTEFERRDSRHSPLKSPLLCIGLGFGCRTMKTSSVLISAQEPHQTHDTDGKDPAVVGLPHDACPKLPETSLFESITFLNTLQNLRCTEICTQRAQKCIATFAMRRLGRCLRQSQKTTFKSKDTHYLDLAYVRRFI